MDFAAVLGLLHGCGAGALGTGVRLNLTTAPVLFTQDKKDRRTKNRSIQPPNLESCIEYIEGLEASIMLPTEYVGAVMDYVRKAPP